MPEKISDAELIELHAQGLTNRKIADELRVSESTVTDRLGRLGLINNTHDVDSSEIKELLIKRVSPTEIARMFNISVAPVNGIADQLYHAGVIP